MATDQGSSVDVEESPTKEPTRKTKAKRQATHAVTNKEIGTLKRPLPDADSEAGEFFDLNAVSGGSGSDLDHAPVAKVTRRKVGRAQIAPSIRPASIKPRSAILDALKQKVSHNCIPGKTSEQNLEGEYFDLDAVTGSELSSDYDVRPALPVAQRKRGRPPKTAMPQVKQMLKTVRRAKNVKPGVSLPTRCA
jgi:hypothetical protein